MLEEASPALAGHWDGALLQPIADINQRMLEGLRALALAGGPAGEQRLPRLVTLLGEDWRRLEPLTLQRLALCPYLLMDAGFGAPELWERLPASTVRGCAGVRRLLRRSRRRRARAPHAAARLASGALQSPGRAGAARHEMHARPSASPASACRTSMRWPSAGAPWIVPRWEQQPLVWRQMFRAARRGAAAQLRVVQLRGLQLIAASCSRPAA